MVRSPRRGWALALYAPFTAEASHQEEAAELANIVVGCLEPATEVYTASRHLYRLGCPQGQQETWWTLERRTDGTMTSTAPRTTCATWIEKRRKTR